MISEMIKLIVSEKLNLDACSFIQLVVFSTQRHNKLPGDSPPLDDLGIVLISTYGL